MNATVRRIRRGEQRVIRLQRRLWLAQLLFWPTVVIGAIAAVGAAWTVWQRRAEQRRSAADRAPSVPTPDKPIGGPVAGY